MKKQLIKKLTILVAITAIFSSCQMSENLYINEDGSGKMSIKMDGSGFMQMMGSKLSGDKEVKRVDSLFSFKDFLKDKKDSIAKLPLEEQKKLKALEKFKMRMVLDPETLKMDFDMFTSFDKVEGLSDLLGSFQKGYSVASKSNKALSGGKQSKALNKQDDDATTKSYYTYSKKMFKRYTEILDAQKLKEQIDSMGPAKSFFGSSKYKLVYHFPRKVKSVSLKEAYFSGDRKTITIETDLVEYLSNPTSLDVEIEFED